MISSWDGFFEEKVSASELRNELYPRERDAFLATVNPNLIPPIVAAAAAGGLNNWCSEGFITPDTDALCAAITSNSAKEAFHEAT